ncbi:type VI secretion system contractile sheath small subunit, partial [Undibacterium seohonense]
MFDSPLKFAQQANADTSATTVQISYDLCTEGVIEKRELPFVVGIFADLSGDRIGDNAPPSSFNLRTMVEIDFNNFNSVMAMAQAMVNLGAIKRTMPKEQIGDKDTLDGNLLFTSLDDFSPMAIVKAVPLLSHWYAQRGQGNSSTADIDLLLTTQLQEIMHSPSFQALEATWRSMHGLVAAVDTNAMLKIKVFNATKDELWSDMEK